MLKVSSFKVGDILFYKERKSGTVMYVGKNILLVESDHGDEFCIDNMNLSSDKYTRVRG